MKKEMIRFYTIDKSWLDEIVETGDLDSNYLCVNVISW